MPGWLGSTAVQHSCMCTSVVQLSIRKNPVQLAAAWQ